MLACLVWMIPFQRQAREKKREEGCGGSLVSRKTSTGRELEPTCSVFSGRGRSICAVLLGKTGQDSSEAACHSSNQLIKAGAPPPPLISVGSKLWHTWACR